MANEDSEDYGALLWARSADMRAILAQRLSRWLLFPEYQDLDMRVDGPWDRDPLAPFRGHYVYPHETWAPGHLWIRDLPAELQDEYQPLPEMELEFNFFAEPLREMQKMWRSDIEAADIWHRTMAHLSQSQRDRLRAYVDVRLTSARRLGTKRVARAYIKFLDSMPASTGVKLERAYAQNFLTGSSGGPTRATLNLINGALQADDCPGWLLAGTALGLEGQGPERIIEADETRIERAVRSTPNCMEALLRLLQLNPSLAEAGDGTEYDEIVRDAHFVPDR